MKKSDNIKKKIEDLNDIDINVRIRAVKALGKYQDSIVVPPLIKAFEDENYAVRSEVVIALGKRKYSNVNPVLINALEDESEYVRKEAVDYFVKRGFNPNIKSEEAVLGLKNILENDESIRVRCSAAEALGYMQDHTAVMPLIRTLECGDDSLKNDAATALGFIKNVRSVPSLMKSLVNDRFVRNKAAEALVIINDIFIVPSLIEAMENEDAEVRKIATKTLGEFKFQEIKNTYDKARQFISNDLSGRRTVKTIDEKIQIENILYPFSDSLYNNFRLDEVLTKNDDPNYISALFKALKEYKSHISRNATDALLEFKDISVTMVLIEALKNNKDPYVRIEATKALGKIRETRAVPSLINALENDENESFSRYGAETLRSSAAEALGKIRDTQAVPSLIYSLENDESESVCNSAAEALRMFKNNETAIYALTNKGI